MFTQQSFPVCHGQSIENQFMARGLDYFSEAVFGEITGHSVMSNIDGFSEMSDVSGHSKMSNVDGHSEMSNVDGHSKMKEEIKNYGG